MAEKTNDPKGILQPTGSDPKPPTSTTTTDTTKEDGGCCLASDIPAPPRWNAYFPDQLTLYGVKLNPYKDATTDFTFGNRVLRLQVGATDGDEAGNEASIAVVYGFSYEGHCYRLDKPKIYVIDKKGTDAQGCGFVPPYLMWHIRARTSVIEIAVSYDIAEVLILEGNLPGNRPPNTYGNHMQLAHRSGKLNRPGGP